ISFSDLIDFALLLKGGWENDETVEEAAVREAIEEAGVRGDLMVTWFQDFLGNYEFRSKTLQDECSPEGLCKAAMFALFVKEELESWPEQSTRKRSWLAVSEALANC
ncbi:Nudix hydrolase 16, mitochondrial, partial [Glycine soja]